MAKPTGFLEYERNNVSRRVVAERIKDFREVNIPHAEDILVEQAARCMDCGVPFCHGIGCPLGNLIPEFNDLVYQGRWRQACMILHSTNNFPEITGRVCPAPCEAACTLNINDNPVLIEHIEYQIVEKGFAEGWITPLPPAVKSGKRVAVVGSGPAGLAVAQQLARIGHEAVVFEKDDRIGGLLRYGIPDFKLEKSVIDRRLEQMTAEGVEFQTGVLVGKDISCGYLQKMFDAVCITIGAGVPRDLAAVGRELKNVHFALDFLCQQNRAVAGDGTESSNVISAKDKTVVVIGGGDTGSDCVGTSIRQGAKQVYQFEILPEPPRECPPDTPWPAWSRILRTSSSHEEGCRRRWSVLTRKLTGVDSGVARLEAVEVDWTNDGTGYKMSEKAGSEFSVKADLVLLAMGYLHPEHAGLVQGFSLELDRRGNVIVGQDSQTSKSGVFAAGDTILGASLVVRAIDSGRKAAEGICRYLAQE